MASLLILKGPNSGQRVELSRDKLVMGRNPDCDVVVPGTAVSRQHAQIIRSGHQFFLEDLQSRNKTYVNNQPLDGRVRLRENDRIKICDFLCTFHEVPVPASGTTAPPLPEDEEDSHSTVLSALEPSNSSQVILESQPADKLKVLLEITNSLSKTLQLDPLLPMILEGLFKIFRQADRGFVILRDESLPNRLIIKTIKTRREKDELNARFSRRIVNQCMENGQAILSEDASVDQRFAMSESISDFRIRSVLCAPLREQDGKVLGVIQLDTQDRTKKFSQEDLQFLVAVSNQAAMAMERAGLHEDLLARERIEHEMHFAKEVQRGFLPARPPTVAGYEFFAHYRSALEVGGDFYNFVNLPHNRLAVMVGDVAGKGVPAALLMAKLSADARYCLLTYPDPAEALGQLNGLLHEGNLGDRFVTFLIAVLDVAKHEITAVNAGHVAPIVLRASRNIEEIAAGDQAGLPLGVVDDFSYKSSHTTLQPGDSLVLCTDGVTEAMNAAEEPLGMERLFAAMKSAASIAPAALGNQVLRTVIQHTAGHHQHDDITLVCLGRNGS